MFAEYDTEFGKLRAQTLKEQNSLLSAKNVGYRHASEMLSKQFADFKDRCATQQAKMLETMKDLSAELQQCRDKKTRSGTRNRLVAENTTVKKELDKLRAELNQCKDNSKSLETANTALKPQLANLQIQPQSSTLDKRPGFLDRIRKVFKAQQSSTELPNEKPARDAARQRAFGDKKSNSGTPIWDRVKRFRKPPTDSQKLRAKYRKVKKTKGDRNWESVNLLP